MYQLREARLGVAPLGRDEPVQKQTREEFVSEFCKTYGLSETDFPRLGIGPKECRPCDDPRCPGWYMDFLPIARKE